MPKKQTDELLHELQAADQVADYLEANRAELRAPNLKPYFDQLLASKQLKKADVVNASQLQRSYAFQILAGKSASRDKLLALAFGFGLNLAECQDLMKKSLNSPLYARDARDAVIIFALENGKTILETNLLLDEMGFDTLDQRSRLR